MCRGDRREAIYHGEDDCRLFLETLGEVCDRTGFRIHSYVLMPNHYHLLLETPEANLVVGMKWFQGTYTQRFNRRHDLSGHLFQGRYKAIPVEPGNGEYFRRVSDYIHLNPARSHLVGSERGGLERYAWSSYPGFTGNQPLPKWLHRGRVFSAHGLGDDGRANQRKYAGIMAQRVSEIQGENSAEEIEAELKKIRRGWYLGSDLFRDDLMDRVDRAAQGKKRESYRNEGMCRHDESEAVKLLEQATRRLKVGSAELCRRKQTDAVKQAVAWWVKSQSVVSDEWLCERLEMGSRSNIYRAVARYREDFDEEAQAIKAKLKLCAD